MTGGKSPWLRKPDTTCGGFVANFQCATQRTAARSCQCSWNSADPAHAIPSLGRTSGTPWGKRRQGWGRPSAVGLKRLRPVPASWWGGRGCCKACRPSPLSRSWAGSGDPAGVSAPGRDQQPRGARGRSSARFPAGKERSARGTSEQTDTARRTSEGSEDRGSGGTPVAGRPLGHSPLGGDPL